MLFNKNYLVFTMLVLAMIAILSLLTLTAEKPQVEIVVTYPPGSVEQSAKPSNASKNKI